MDPAHSSLSGSGVLEVGTATFRERIQAPVVAAAREFGPLAVALAGGTLLGVVASGTTPIGEGRAELARVVLVGALASAAILPSAEPRVGGVRATGLPRFARTARRSAAFALVFAILGCASAARAGFRIDLALVPVVAFLQCALALGLAFFAAAADEFRIGRLLPARVLVPAWVLATPAVWLVERSAAAVAPAWNPLHHLVTAWRAILLPGANDGAHLAESMFALAPAALLVAVLGFTAWSAVDAHARAG